MYELFIYGLLFISGSGGSPALVGDNTQQGLRAGRPTRAKISFRGFEKIGFIYDTNTKKHTDIKTYILQISLLI